MPTSMITSNTIIYSSLALAFVGRITVWTIATMIQVAISLLVLLLLFCVVVSGAIFALYHQGYLANPLERVRACIETLVLDSFFRRKSPSAEGETAC
ncbi:hypothetical protein NEDG_00693 [Nematocida displodere]|uniref:Uncharacterized protein n=1 Tax=Nematocida displodere TaxID=1805483 RepID=A0A177EDT7_9MICR|nr:hypothetical protein NEDG_00693 [Nematocida displodere]